MNSIGALRLYADFHPKHKVEIIYGYCEITFPHTHMGLIEVSNAFGMTGCHHGY